MSHEIGRYDSGAFNEPAWHGLLKVKGDYFTKEFALDPNGANVGWRVGVMPLQVPVVMPDGTTKIVIVPDYQMTYREDLPADNPYRYLAPVGGRYTPIQNADAADMAESIAEASGACFASAFSMKNGRKVVFLLKLPETVRALDDTLETYLMVCNTHDGTKVLEAILTNVRVVCNNTYTMAIGGAENVWRIRHTDNATTRIDEAKAVLGLVRNFNEKFGDAVTELAQKKVNDAFVDAYFKALFPINPNGKFSTRTLNIRNTVRSLYEGGMKGANMDAIKGTRWGLVNAVTEYVDHKRTIRVTKGRDFAEARADSLLFGSGATLKQTAFNLAVNADTLLEEAMVSN